MKVQKQKGFSLIELLIVVAIILIIAAIAIPNLMKARVAANQASAVGSLRTIVASEVSYMTSYGQYAAGLTALGGAAPCTSTAAAACLIDPVLASGTKSGYKFTYAPLVTGGTNTGYTVTANATTQGSTGDVHYFTDNSGVIRFNIGAAATASSAALQ